MAAKKKGKKAVAKKVRSVRVTPKKSAKKKSAKKKPVRRKTTAKKNVAARTRSSSNSRARKKKRPARSVSSKPRRANIISGDEDSQGLSNVESSDSESVSELLEEGNAFEAGVVSGVEQADDEDEREVRTRQIPEDDVPKNISTKTNGQVQV